MAKPREEDPNGAVYHVFARGNDRCEIYRDAKDRHLYLRLLADAAERMGWKVLAYCQMGNHVHLVIETSEGNLGAGMRLVHGRYAQAFNRRHGRVGHLFQGRYGSKQMEDDRHLCMTLRYVGLNPVQAGLCLRAEDWEWSSCAATLHPQPESPPWLHPVRALEAFDWLGGDARERYAEMLAPPHERYAEMLAPPRERRAEMPAPPARPGSGLATAVHEPGGQRDGGELVHGEPREETGIELRDEPGELLALRRAEVAPAAAPGPDELHEPPALDRGQPRHVLPREHGDLRDREQAEDRKPPDQGQARDQADGNAGHLPGLPRRAPP